MSSKMIPFSAGRSLSNNNLGLEIYASGARQVSSLRLPQAERTSLPAGQGVLNEVVGEVRGLEFDHAIRLAGERPRDQAVVLHVLGRNFYHAGHSAQPRIIDWVDHLLLALEAFNDLLLGDALSRALLHQGPVGLAAPARRDQRRRIILAIADLEHVLGDAGVRGPFGEFGTLRHVDHAHLAPKRSPRLCQFSIAHRHFEVSLSVEEENKRKNVGWPHGLVTRIRSSTSCNNTLFGESRLRHDRSAGASETPCSIPLRETSPDRVPRRASWRPCRVSAPPPRLETAPSRHTDRSLRTARQPGRPDLVPPPGCDSAPSRAGPGTDPRA